MPLTARSVENARPGPRLRRVLDSRGLFLEITPQGGKRWRLRYRFEGREKMISLGLWPDVSLKMARERRDEARRLLASGIDPSAHRKAAKAERTEKGKHSFEGVAREWLARRAPLWSAPHVALVERRLEKDVLPALGARPLGDITVPEVLEVLRRIEDRSPHTAKRARQDISRIFEYAIAEGRADRDPAASLQRALQAPQTMNHPAITDPVKLGGMLRAIEGYEGHAITRWALQLAPLLFVRPGELRHAEWPEIDLETGEWVIPAVKMKMRKDHMVPLARQAVAILREAQALTGGLRYVFPSLRTAERPMSNNTVNGALRRLGYAKEEVAGHGFRATARTLLHEVLGEDPDVIELQLAHTVPDRLGAAYNRTRLIPQRKEMMQRWADYLDTLKAGEGSKVVPIRKGAS